MRFIDIYNAANHRTAHVPGTTVHKNRARDWVNEDYQEMFSDKLYDFAQRESEVSVYSDAEASDGVVTNGSRQVTTATAFFLSWMQGQILDIAGTEYEIVVVNSSTEAYLTANYAGATDTGVAFTAIHRHVILPFGCVQLLKAWIPANQVLLYNYARLETENWQLDEDLTGVPDAWAKTDPLAVPGPVVAPTAALTAGGTMTESTYEFAYSWKYMGLRGPLSSGVEITTTAANATVDVTLPATPANSGFLKTLWAKMTGWEAFRLVEDDIDEAANPAQLTAPIETNWVRAARAPEHDGFHQRFQLWYRQGDDYTLRIRFQWRPPKLLEDNDAPQFPSARHKYLVARLAARMFRAKNNPELAAVQDHKADFELAKIGANHLSVKSRVHLKGDWDEPWGRNVRRRTFVHVP